MLDNGQADPLCLIANPHRKLSPIPLVVFVLGTVFPFYLSAIQVILIGGSFTHEQRAPSAKELKPVRVLITYWLLYGAVRFLEVVLTAAGLLRHISTLNLYKCVALLLFWSDFSGLASKVNAAVWRLLEANSDRLQAAPACALQVLASAWAAGAAQLRAALRALWGGAKRVLLKPPEPEQTHAAEAADEANAGGEANSVREGDAVEEGSFEDDIESTLTEISK
eukprot:gnl/Chilomastix_cuspidata/2353.p1 GENE.gnl/Chilomastix_cuspidata/2353~~gnl/Chilomastix_cuspidata/2353.p1  ORF type:complete len:223 (+),score=59.27 gnl/Chilomastix_cuspidata/2353:104-772(+)